MWVGWFGFNAGSAVAANGSAGMAMLVTQVATAMAALTWMVVEWVKHGKPSVLGIVTGAVGGLVFPAIFSAITSYGPMFIVAAAGLIIGALSVLPRTDESNSRRFDTGLAAGSDQRIAQ